MKPVQIVLLVIAGALGGAIVTRSWNKPKPAPQVTAEVGPSAPAPVSPPAADPTPAAPAPVATTPPQAELEPPKPSPVARRLEAPKQQRRSRPAPPPANPRPVETARVEPPPVTRPEPAPAPVVSVPPARSEPEHATPPPPPPPPAPNKVTLNAGTLLPVRLIDGLSSERNAPGDTFTGTLDSRLVVDGFVLAERGARVEGRVAEVDPGGKIRGVSSMSIHLTRIHTADRQTIPIQTDTFTRQAEASRTNDAAKVGIGAAAGAIIGAIAGGGKGAAIGAGVGGGAGAGTVLMTRGKAVTFPSETRISFRLSAPVTVTEQR
jgi:hypothetical protein